jgi:N-acetylmuramoyl-L-alanine amidase
MRPIDGLVIHCSATVPSLNIGKVEINSWHMARGFNGIGYSFVIRRNGSVEDGRPVEVPGAHVHGHNARTIGICLVGGLDANQRACSDFMAAYNPVMDAALAKLVKQLLQRWPRATVLGHRDYPDVAKSCPCFSVRDWCRAHGIKANGAAAGHALA